MENERKKLERLTRAKKDAAINWFGQFTKEGPNIQRNVRVMIKGITLVGVQQRKDKSIEQKTEPSTTTRIRRTEPKNRGRG